MCLLTLYIPTPIPDTILTHIDSSFIEFPPGILLIIVFILEHCCPLPLQCQLHYIILIFQTNIPNILQHPLLLCCNFRQQTHILSLIPGLIQEMINLRECLPISNLSDFLLNPLLHCRHLLRSVLRVLDVQLSQLLYGN